MARPAPQVDRVVAVIDRLTDAVGGLTLTELSVAVGSAPSSMVHVLAALEQAGYVVRDPSDRRYRLGPALVRAGAVADAVDPLLVRAREQMLAITARFGVPCAAFVRDGRWARLVHLVEPPCGATLGLRVGEMVPVAPPLGTVFVAWGSDADIDRWLDEAGAAGPDRRSALRAALARAREKGFVVEGASGVVPGDEALRDAVHAPPSPTRDRTLRSLLAADSGSEAVGSGGRPALATTGVAAPVLGGDGEIRLAITAITFASPLGAVDLAALGAAVRDAAAAISTGT